MLRCDELTVNWGWGDKGETHSAAIDASCQLLEGYEIA